MNHHASLLSLPRTPLSRRSSLALALGASAALGLAACSDPGAKGSKDQSAPASWPKATDKLEGVKLTVWAAQSSNKIPAKVAQAFEAATGAKVEIVTIPDPYEQGVQTKVATGDLPDLAMWQPTASQLTAIGAKERLQVLDGAPWEAKTVKSVLNAGGKLDDHRYAAFISAPSVMGVWYNKEVFAANGAKIPTSFTELLTLARDLKAKGITPLHEMGGEWWASQWTVQAYLADAAKTGLWDKVNQNQDQFTGKDIQGAIDQYKAMIDEGLYNQDIKTATFDEQAKAVLEGKAAMALQVNSLLANMAAQTDSTTLDQKIGFFPVSATSATATSIPEQTNAVVAFKTGDAKREAAARQFLVFWLSDGYADFVKDQNLVSIIEGVQTPASVPTAIKEAYKALDGAIGSMQSLAIANPDLAKNLGDMIAGTKTAAQVGEETQSQFAQLAKAIGAKGF
ncbi:carbohydrate ABC transporter substrate-binding protein, CPR_0540 family [Actinomyces bovis]|uniref:Carbohydrate ABC transporter substrate-binding protein, CPR_0540 family n=1 Tax=Actinomyces bovis TaxID=1658 RepID=A0ABY1VQZ0_9ACTO|nr:ABC transporter substrate-binding protein [Actinomyces bovis]SPT54440.1 carbohydrate ABC transporter substrate-binding protein, CPR_0540 family [Actinomyces bovis]VEG55958.1 carbohydrate ABC transporter substrate-binding protein, CPR_0540 family [Actinomyces israelii]